MNLRSGCTFGFGRAILRSSMIIINACMLIKYASLTVELSITLMRIIDKSTKKDLNQTYLLFLEFTRIARTLSSFTGGNSEKMGCICSRWNVTLS